LAADAVFERTKISERTREGLRAVRASGVSLADWVETSTGLGSYCGEFALIKPVEFEGFNLAQPACQRREQSPKSNIDAQGASIGIRSKSGRDYISITDMARTSRVTYSVIRRESPTGTLDMYVRPNNTAERGAPYVRSLSCVRQ
jgi:hypothetical protein